MSLVRGIFMRFLKIFQKKTQKYGFFGSYCKLFLHNIKNKMKFLQNFSLNNTTWIYFLIYYLCKNYKKSYKNYKLEFFAI